MYSVQLRDNRNYCTVKADAAYVKDSGDVIFSAKNRPVLVLRADQWSSFFDPDHMIKNVKCFGCGGVRSCRCVEPAAGRE